MIHTTAELYSLPPFYLPPRAPSPQSSVDGLRQCYGRDNDYTSVHVTHSLTAQRQERTIDRLWVIALRNDNASFSSPRRNKAVLFAFGSSRGPGWLPIHRQVEQSCPDPQTNVCDLSKRLLSNYFIPFWDAVFTLSYSTIHHFPNGDWTFL